MTRRRLALRVEEPPDAADVETIKKALIAFNEEKTGRPLNPRRFLVSVRDGDGALVGGLTGVTYWDWLYVGELWLDERLRGRGWGRRLLDRAERIAVARGCRAAWLDTFSFQAPGFYRRLGWREFGSLDDQPSGESRHFFWKPLARAPKKRRRRRKGS